MPIVWTMRQHELHAPEVLVDDMLRETPEEEHDKRHQDEAEGCTKEWRKHNEQSRPGEKGHIERA
jgi:hypothetical protein